MAWSSSLADDLTSRRPQLVDVSEDELSLPCQTLEVPTALFAAVAPKPDELDYLVHVRLVDAERQVRADAADAGWYAVVVANRTPRAARGRRPSRLAGGPRSATRRHGDEGARAPRVARELELHRDLSRRRQTRDDELRRRRVRLAAAPAGERADLALGLPYDATQGRPEPRTDPDERVADRLAAGYAPSAITCRPARTRSRGIAARCSPPQRRARQEGAAVRVLVRGARLRPGDGRLRRLARGRVGDRPRAGARRPQVRDRARAVPARSVHRLVDLVLAGLESQHIDTPDNLSRRQERADRGALPRPSPGRPGRPRRDGAKARSRRRSPRKAADPPDDPVDAVKKLLEAATTSTT